MDLLPKIIEAARSRPVVIVRCNRPERMAKELRKHLPLHTVTARVTDVLIHAPVVYACSSGPACSASGKDGV